jgi:hypothetical protein
VRRLADALLSGAVASVTSGIPSTTWTLLEGGDVLEAGRAVGKMVLPHEERTVVLLAAGAPVHGALSLGWAGVLATVLPERREPLWGPVGGLAIAALDLGLLARRFPPVAALPQGRQWADHLAFGFSVGVVLRATRQAGCRRGRRGGARSWLRRP